MTHTTSLDELLSLRSQNAQLRLEIESLERGGYLAKLLLMDTINGIEVYFGADGLEKIVAHAKAANRAREANAEIDDLELALTAGQNQP